MVWEVTNAAPDDTAVRPPDPAHSSDVSADLPLSVPGLSSIVCCYSHSQVAQVASARV